MPRLAIVSFNFEPSGIHQHRYYGYTNTFVRILVHCGGWAGGRSGFSLSLLHTATGIICPEPARASAGGHARSLDSTTYFWRRVYFWQDRTNLLVILSLLLLCRDASLYPQLLLLLVASREY